MKLLRRRGFKLRSLLLALAGLLGLLAHQVSGETKVLAPLLGELHVSALLGELAALLFGWAALRAPGHQVAPPSPHPPAPAPSPPADPPAA